MDTSPFSIAILHFMEPLMQAENPFSGTDTIFSATMVVDENENALGCTCCTAGESIYFLVCFTRIHFAGASIRSGTPVKGAMTSSTW